MDFAAGFIKGERVTIRSRLILVKRLLKRLGVGYVTICNSHILLFFVGLLSISKLILSFACATTKNNNTRTPIFDPIIFLQTAVKTMNKE